MSGTNQLSVLVENVCVLMENREGTKHKHTGAHQTHINYLGEVREEVRNPLPKNTVEGQYTKLIKSKFSS